MTTLLSKIFGRYTQQVIIQFNGFGELLICTFLFCWYFKRKKHFIWRLAICLPLAFTVVFFNAMLRTHFPNLATRFIGTLVMNALSLILIFVCFLESKSEKLICWCGGISTQQVTAAAIGIIYALCGVDDKNSISFFPTMNETRDWLIYYAMHLALYVIYSLIFSRQKRTQNDTDSLKNIVILSVFAVMLVTLVNNVSRQFESGDLIVRMIVKILFFVCFTFVLIIRTGIFTQSNFKRELQIMDQLLYEEKKQFQSVKTNIDIVNMKCHDLKHRLSGFEDKLTETELNSLKDALNIYDSVLKSGNDILDVVLYEKQLLCEKEKISLSCMADGKILSFLSASHIYSIFANALDNAIDAVKILPEEDMRTVSIVVKQEQGLIKINVLNYYSDECVVVDGLPQTSKKDTVHHGYGIKSIKYIASLYGGDAHVTAANKIFELSIVFPPQ